MFRLFSSYVVKNSQFKALQETISFFLQIQHPSLATVLLLRNNSLPPSLTPSLPPSHHPFQPPSLNASSLPFLAPCHGQPGTRDSQTQSQKSTFFHVHLRRMCVASTSLLQLFLQESCSSLVLSACQQKTKRAHKFGKSEM